MNNRTFDTPSASNTALDALGESGGWFLVRKAGEESHVGVKTGHNIRQEIGANKRHSEGKGQG
jgi:hypothetical protein